MGAPPELFIICKGLRRQAATARSNCPTLCGPAPLNGSPRGLLELTASRRLWARIPVRSCKLHSFVVKEGDLEEEEEHDMERRHATQNGHRLAFGVALTVREAVAQMCVEI